MFSLLNALAHYIDVVLLQPITSTIETILTIFYYFIDGSCFVGYCLVQGAIHLWHILFECYQLTCNFYTEFKLTLKDTTEYICDGTGDSLRLAEKVTGLLLKLLSNLFIGLGQGILWILLLLPRAIIAILDYVIVLLNAFANYIFNGGINLLHNCFRFCIGLAALLLLYMFRRYVLLFAIYQFKRLQNASIHAWNKLLQWADLKLFRLLQKLDFGKENTNAPSNGLNCVVCMERSRNVVVLPCRHLCMCQECSQQLSRLVSGNRCPVCRHSIETLLPVYS